MFSSVNNRILFRFNCANVLSARARLIAPTSLNLAQNAPTWQAFHDYISLILLTKYYWGILTFHWNYFLLALNVITWLNNHCCFTFEHCVLKKVLCEVTEQNSHTFLIDFWMYLWWLHTMMIISHLLYTSHWCHVVSFSDNSKEVLALSANCHPYLQPQCDNVLDNLAIKSIKYHM